MTITPKEAVAYLELEKSIGKLDMDPMDVSEANTDLYEKNARSYAANALYYYSAYRLSLDPELAGMQKKIIEERMAAETAKAKARAAEKRESQVLGLLSGLAPRANKLPKSEVIVGTDDMVFGIRVYSRKELVFVLEYDRATYLLNGILLGTQFETEDWSSLNGSSSPTLQSNAYAAVANYLDSVEVEK